MGRDTYRYRQLDKEREERKRLNPIWRGVGCLLLVVMAVGGYAFAGWFLAANLDNGWVYIPPQAVQPAFMPAWAPYGILVQLIVAFLFLLFGFGLISVFYALLFPIKPGETDVPPLRRRKVKGTYRSRGR